MTRISLPLGQGMSIEQDLTDGFLGYHKDRHFWIFRGGKKVTNLTPSQDKVLHRLLEKKVMTPSQLSKELKMTSAGVLYPLESLVAEGIVERVEPILGGSVFYVLKWNIRTELEPSLKAIVEPKAKEAGGWRKLADIPLSTLRQELANLTEDEFYEVIDYLVKGTHHE